MPRPNGLCRPPESQFFEAFFAFVRCRLEFDAGLESEMPEAPPEIAHRRSAIGGRFRGRLQSIRTDSGQFSRSSRQRWLAHALLPSRHISLSRSADRIGAPRSTSHLAIVLGGALQSFRTFHVPIPRAFIKTSVAWALTSVAFFTPPASGQSPAQSPASPPVAVTDPASSPAQPASAAAPQTN